MLRHAAFLSLILLFCFPCTGLEAQQFFSMQGTNAPAEIDPLLRPDGQELFFTRPKFTSNKGSDNAADIWTVSRYADGSWGRPLNPGSPINSFAHDRALAFSPDGNRLAVLRTGAVSFLEILEKSGRNWRILDSWPLPEGVAPRYDVTFDLNALQLIYSTYDGGNLDLYRRDALSNGMWSAPKEIRETNGPGNETAPALAADGRTLYFRRDGGQWFRRDAPGLFPVSVSIPSTIQQFSASLSSAEIIAALPATATKKKHLALLSAIPSDMPAPVVLERGYLAGPPPPGEQTARIALTDGQLLTIYPDALNRYSVFLRAGEALAVDSSLPPRINNGRPQGSLATTGAEVSGEIDRQQLQAGIARRQRELDRLDAERRKYDLVAPKTDDPELSALRDQYQRSTMSPSDTIPPSSRSAKGSSSKDPYAAELAELERMKAKFRQQQNEKLGQRTTTSHQWSEKSAAPAPATAARKVPSIGDSYRSPTPVVRTQAEKERAYNDSLRFAAEVRAGLKRDNTPRVYERASWENQVRQGLPRTQPLSPEEVAQLDADYQQQLNELEALRAELRRLDSEPAAQPATYGQPAAPNRPAARTWDAKGAPTTSAPATGTSPYSRPATPTKYDARTPASLTSREVIPEATTPRSPGLGAPMPAGISFIPNTAYPDSRGYTGLDQLVGLIQQSTSILEIRVHTPAKLDPRAAQLLSEERATTIRNFLVNKGIAPNNYQVVGYGNNLTGEQGERVEVLR